MQNGITKKSMFKFERPTKLTADTFVKMKWLVVCGTKVTKRIHAMITNSICLGILESLV